MPNAEVDAQRRSRWLNAEVDSSKAEMDGKACLLQIRETLVSASLVALSLVRRQAQTCTE